MKDLSELEREDLQLQEKYPQNEPEAEPVKKQNSSGLSIDMFRVTKEYTDSLGKEKFLYQDLVVLNHILTIIGKTGSGKSAFMLREVIPKLCKQGYMVWFFDADSATSDHAWIREHAERHGFEFLNPHANQGTSVAGMIKMLQQMVKQGYDFTDHVIIFDTLKKFADMLHKNSLKAFYVLGKAIAAKGGTIIALGHANKYADKASGNLIFEGTNEVITDTDELIYFYKSPAPFGGVDVTTVVDIDRDAKTRGVFKPFSFNISEDRTITLYDKPIDTESTSNVVSDLDIIESLKKCLEEHGKPVLKKELVNYAWSKTGAGRSKVEALLDKNSVPEGAHSIGWKMFTFEKGERKSKFYKMTGNR